MSASPWKSGPSGPGKSRVINAGFSPRGFFLGEIEFFRSLLVGFEKLSGILVEPKLRLDIVNRYRIAVVALTLFLAVACGPTTVDQPPLRAATVALQPLRHWRTDPLLDFPELFPLQVAVLWTRTEDGVVSPLALTHALNEMGIPFFLTQDCKRAVRHRLVIVYPGVDETSFHGDEVQQLIGFVRSGGIVFAQNALWGGIKPLFGFHDFTASRQRYLLKFQADAGAVAKYLNRPEEREVRLGSRNYNEIIWSNGYSADPGAKVLARFEDGSVAFLANSIGQGTAYLLGVSLADVVLRSQNNRDYEAERHYVNCFEPGADVWLLILRAWYETYAKDWVRLATIPNGQRSALLLSHDVDWEYSFAPALDFAEVEKANRANSTFFVQTKYVSDANSKAFFFEPNLQILRRLKSGGASLGSHSVIHSHAFATFALGSGHETYATYSPRGLALDTASGATVFGEVRVSKELLDGQIPEQQTVFFRAGHLRAPRSLGEALERSGYRFDSSFTADDVLSNFPYALPRDPGFEQDSDLYEFPVTIEDEEAPGFAERVPQALDVIEANAENGAVSVLLVHSNESRRKAAAEARLLQQLPEDILKTDMLTFATFWRARDRLRWSVRPTADPHQVLLAVESDETVSGLTFEFARRVSIPADAQTATVSADQRKIILAELKAEQSFTLRVRFLP